MRELEPEDRRYQFAEQKVKELEAVMPRLTVELAPGAPPETQVWQNDTPLGGSLGIPLPLNPGVYKIVVEAPGFQTQAISVELAERENKTITVEPGEKLRAVQTNVDPKTSAQEKPEADLGLSQTTWGYLIGGVGIAGLGTALTLTVVALGEKAKVNENCPDKDNSEAKRAACVDAKSAGRTLATTATAAGTVGAVALAVGAYLVFSDDEEEAAVEAGLFEGFHGVRVRGVF
jgi:hypothetical protein